MKDLKNNMWIWEKVEETNPSTTKEASMGGRKITTINATEQIEQATKIFGAYGDGFGISNIQYDEKEFSNGTILLIANAIFFYRNQSNEQVSFPISSSLKYCYMTNGQKKYLKVDDEAFKKIETDITTKALSKLGFAADIFKGRYDDNKYVNSLEEKYKSPEAKEEEEKLQKEEEEKLQKLIVDTVKKDLGKTKSLEEIATLWGVISNDLKQDEKILSMFSEKKKALTK
jgi:hypothetical protein